MRSSGARLGLALLVVLFSYSHLAAQERVCPKVQAVGGMTGYQVRAGDQRCEGFYQSPVAGASLELLSLTAGPVEYRLNERGILRIAAPDVSRLKSDRVQVLARALPLGTYYRMDATARSGQALSWPMAAVLAPTQLTPDTIGVVAWIEQNADRIYVPVRVSDSSEPAPQGTRIIAIMRATIDLDDFRWRGRQDGDSGRPPEWKKELRSGQVLRAGQPIRLELDPSRDRIVEVQGKAINSDKWYSLQLRVFGS
ncbi:MAG TPA: hypothetical protein VGX95_04290 [Xanthobacteraceae bacterium]|jgi:hypothetical protein|nr:hypothetical protein [Xanthobacteraceae bacterium]